MKFGYTLIYVSDVPATLAFYEAAFGLQTKFLHESNDYGELDTGETALGFLSNQMAEFNGVKIEPNDPSKTPAGFEIVFVTEDVQAAYDTAVKAGASPQSPPAEKPWGQVVAYVRDLNGCLVELCSPMS